MVRETTAVSLTVEPLSGGAAPEASPKKKRTAKAVRFFFGDPYENRTRVTAVKGRCLNRLTNGPLVGARIVSFATG